MIRLITEVLMAINTRGDKSEDRSILIYNRPITTTSNKYYSLYDSASELHANTRHSNYCPDGKLCI